MTISFFQPGDVPQPADKVKIEHLEATPYEDGWRVRLIVHVTPFQKRPNLEIGLIRQGGDFDGKMAAHLSIIETMHPKMEFTMHIRGVDTPYGDYLLKAVLYFRDSPEEGEDTVAPMQPSDTKEVLVNIAESGA